MKLFSMPSSGNSYKVRLLLALLDLPYQHIPCEDATPETENAKAAGALAFGKLPALHLDDGTQLAESGAILWYLAQGSTYLPTDPMAQSQVLAWMFFEQNRMEGVIAVRASLRCYPRHAASATPERLASLLDTGHELLQIVEDHLSQTNWLVGNAPTIADIALYGYVHSSGDRGGYEMDRFPAIGAWCDRIKTLPNYISLDHMP